jgi:ubiquinone/menaquinone biosynthesis C-methylase UbiE
MNRLDVDYEWRVWFGRNPVRRIWKRRLAEEVVRQLGSYGGPLLDIGCGSSPQVCKFHNVVGMDISVGKLGFVGGKTGGKFVGGSSDTLPFKSRIFDRIVVSEVIEHLSDPDLLERESFRCLKPGGRIVIATPDSHSLVWRSVEWLDKKIQKNGHCSDHTSKFDLPSLRYLFPTSKWEFIGKRRLFGSDLVVSYKKR